jgi:cell division protein FtsZ
MPEVDDLPRPVQDQIRISRGELAAPVPPQPETRRKTLLEKLAAFGINRQEDAPAAPPAPMRTVANPNLTSLRPAAAAPGADYVRPAPRAIPPRVAQGQLDPHGRVSSRAPIAEDEQLEIPAFLRRQPGG